MAAEVSPRKANRKASPSIESRRRVGAVFRSRQMQLEQRTKRCTREQGTAACAKTTQRECRVLITQYEKRKEDSRNGQARAKRIMNGLAE